MSSLGLVLILNAVFFLSVFFIQNVFVALIITTVALFTILFILRQTKIISAHHFFNIERFTSKHYNFLIVCLIIFLVLEKPIGVTASLFASFFVFAYLNKLEYRISFFLALMVLIITSLLIAGKNYVAAEISSKITYFFLIVGVVWYFVEFVIKKLGEFNNYSLSND